MLRYDRDDFALHRSGLVLFACEHTAISQGIASQFETKRLRSLFARLGSTPIRSLNLRETELVNIDPSCEELPDRIVAGKGVLRQGERRQLDNELYLTGVGYEPGRNLIPDTSSPAGDFAAE